MTGAPTAKAARRPASPTVPEDRRQADRAQAGGGPGAAELAALFAAALLRRDAATAAACFGTGAKLLSADGTEVSGAAAIRSLLEQLTSSDVRLAICLGRTVLAGHLALSTQYWRRTGPAGAARFEHSSTVSLLLAREAGRWAIMIAAPWG